MATFIKIPITLENVKQMELIGLEKAPECDTFALIRVDLIESIRCGHDDRISEDINTEATVITMVSDDSFLVRMHIDEVVLMLKQYNNNQFFDPLK